MSRASAARVWSLEVRDETYRYRYIIDIDIASLSPSVVPHRAIQRLMCLRVQLQSCTRTYSYSYMFGVYCTIGTHYLLFHSIQHSAATHRDMGNKLFFRTLPTFSVPPATGASALARSALALRDYWKSLNLKLSVCFPPLHARSFLYLYPYPYSYSS